MPGDIAIGIPDGITIPFVLAAGLSAVTENGSVIIITSLTAVGIGAIAMGLGAFFTARTESEHFNTDLKVKDLKERKFLSGLDIGTDIQDLAAEEIAKENDRWNDLLVQRHGNAKAGKSGITIGIAYLAGGMLPLIPFFIFGNVMFALKISGLITFVALAIAGFIKCRITGMNPWAGTLRILIFAALAAAGAYGVAAIINR